MSIPPLGSQVISFEPNQAPETNEYVAEAQRALNLIEGSSILSESGVFDDATRLALTRFQQAHQLRPNGEIDQRTADLLNRTAAEHNQPVQQQASLSNVDRARRIGELQSAGALQQLQLGRQLTADSQRTVAENIAERTTRNQIRPSERLSFDRIEAANNQTEARGRFVSSGRGTTAGQPASIGRGQLLTRFQIGQTLGNPELAQLTNVPRQALREMNQRGNAAMEWYDLIASNRVNRRTHDLSQQTLRATGLTEQQAHEVRELSAQGRGSEILNRPEIVQHFEQRTGLSQNELQTMINSRGLNTNAYRQEFQQTRNDLRREFQQTQNQFQNTFNSLRAEFRGNPRQALEETIRRHPELQGSTIPENMRMFNPQRFFREAAIRSLIHNPNHPELRHFESSSRLNVPEFIRQGAADRVIQNHSDLQNLLEVHPGSPNRMNRESMVRYFEDGRVNENRNGWFTLGAQTMSSEWNQFRSDLQNLDIVTNRNRSIDNFAAARRVTGQMAGFSNLSQQEQDRITGQIARVHHFGDEAFLAHFGENNMPHSVEEFLRWRDALPPDNQLAVAIRNFTRNFDGLPAQTS